MNEYIKRKDAFEILQSRLDSISQMSYLNMDWHELDIMRNAIENAIDDIGEVSAADVQPVDRWISVKDRLPEEQQCILAYEKDYGVMWGDYQGIKYSQPVWIVRKQGLIIRTTEVTHWQPLPEPPQD